MNAKVTGSLKICAPLNDGLDSTRAHHSANLALFFNASSMRLIMLYLEKFSKLLEKILDIVTFYESFATPQFDYYAKVSRGSHNIRYLKSGPAT